MGFVLQASCPKCKYQSRELVVGDGVHFIFVCENCDSVVNLQRTPFRFTWSTCPNCKKLARQPIWIDAANQVISRHESIESAYQCPQCKNSPLGFREIAHFSRSFDDRVPTIGMLVHGRLTESGELEIPFLVKFYAEAHLDSNSGRAPNQIMELRVVRVEPKPPDEKGEPGFGMNVFCEFVRYLTQQDLERESMEQLRFKSKTHEFLKACGLFADEQ